MSNNNKLDNMVTFQDYESGKIYACYSEPRDIWEWPEDVHCYMAGGAMVFEKNRHLPVSLFAEGDDLFPWDDIDLSYFKDEYEDTLTEEAKNLFAKYPEGSIISLDAYCHGATAIHPSSRNPMRGDWDNSRCIGLWFPHSEQVKVMQEGAEILPFLKITNKYDDYTGTLYRYGKIVWRSNAGGSLFSLVREVKARWAELNEAFGPFDRLFTTQKEANEAFVMPACTSDCSLVTDGEEYTEIKVCELDLTGKRLDSPDFDEYVQSYYSEPVNGYEACAYALADYMQCVFKCSERPVWDRDELALYIMNQPEITINEEV